MLLGNGKSLIAVAISLFLAGAAHAGDTPKPLPPNELDSSDAPAPAPPPDEPVEPYRSPFGAAGMPSCSQQGPSWESHPFSMGWFAGIVQGSTLITDWISMERGFYGGYRMDWNFDPHWSAGFRLAIGSMKLVDSAAAKQAQQNADTLAGYAADDPWRLRFDSGRNGDLFQGDVDVAFYPTGDTRFRPYVSFGLGGTRVSFMDRLSENYAYSLFSLPISVGAQYLFTDSMALRLDCTDDIAFGRNNYCTLQNVSLTAGVEVRFGGGTHFTYWPWNPGSRVW
jgi:opacity protein-like surface antigen